MATVITVDRGNSFTKLGRFENGRPAEVVRVPHQAAAEVLALWCRGSIEGAALASVHDDTEDLRVLLHGVTRVIRLGHTTPLPIGIRYETPETLGADRVANAVAACAEFGQGAILVVDCGTCITCTMVRDGMLLGGSIGPGSALRFRALHEGTGRLPLVGPAENPELLGQDTRTSIQSGVQLGLRAEIAGLVDLYRAQFGEMTVVMTGGDAPLFEPHLKSTIFARPNLTLTGLYEIYQYNQH